MKKSVIILIFTLFSIENIFAQINESNTEVNKATVDSFVIVKKDTNLSSIKDNPGDFQYFRRPTLPPMRIKGSRYMNIDVNSGSPFNDPQQTTNWDALQLPTNRYDYELTNEYLEPLIRIAPLDLPKEKAFKPLSIFDYSIPTRGELDILEILWINENVCDTTIYTCLDSTLNITMEDLNKLLERMTKRGFVRRKIVSPRNEFNAFGVLIEMSPQNIRNRIYAYQTNVDRNLMQRFINANEYLYRNDSSIVNQKQLHAAQKDTALLKDLNEKMFMISR